MRRSPLWADSAISAIWQAPCRTERYEENTLSDTAFGRGIEFCTVVSWRKNWAASAPAGDSCPSAGAGARVLLGGRLLVSSRRPLPLA